ncbi:MAG: hypothetical protein AB7K86_01225 [Rhodospirillales bacterium]
MTGRRPSRAGIAALAAAGALVLSGCAGPAPEQGAARAAPTAEALRLDPKGLIGMDGARLRQLLGAPQFVRHEATAEVWRYRYGTCQVYLFLYPEGAAAPPRLRHMELRGMAGPVATPADCRAAPERAAEATES